MQVIGRISRASLTFDRAIATSLNRFDLHPSEFDVLATLLRDGAPHELQVSDLVKRTMVTAAAVSQRLNKLEGRGLVTRRIDSENRRAIIVTLTAEGYELISRALTAHVETEHTLLNPLTVTERNQLACLLRKLLLSLGDRPFSGTPG